MSNRALPISWCFGVLGVVLCLTLGSPAFGQTVDPLHGVGSEVAPGSGDIRTNTPTTANPPSPFGFISFPGGISGELLTDGLVHNNEDNDSTGRNFTITGATASPVGAALASARNGNDLGTYLGLSTPPQPNLIETIFSRPQAFALFPFPTDFAEHNKSPSPSSLTEPFATTGSGPSAPYLTVFLSQDTCPGPSCGYNATKLPSKAGFGGLSILIKIAPLLAVLGVGVALGFRLGRGASHFRE